LIEASEDDMVRSIGGHTAMRKTVRTMTMVLAIVGSSAGAYADPATGDACAANLSPDGKAIYAAVVAANPTLQTLRDVVTEQTRGLALNGQISRDTARSNAILAGECMRIRLN
jgi:hypothetical protein